MENASDATKLPEGLRYFQEFPTHVSRSPTGSARPTALLAQLPETDPIIQAL